MTDPVTNPTRHPLWPFVIILSAALLSLLVFVDIPLLAPLRPVVALWFLCACPGLAFVPLLRLHDTVIVVCLAVALSLALATLVAGTLLYTGRWSPAGATAILIGISLIGAAWQLLNTPKPEVEIAYLKHLG